MIRLEMENCNKILKEKQQRKTLALSPGKFAKYEYLIGEGILPPDQGRVIQQAKFAYSPLGKPFERQIQTIEDQGEKQRHLKSTVNS